MEGKNKANCESICKRQYVDISEKKKKEDNFIYFILTTMLMNTACDKLCFCHDLD